MDEIVSKIVKPKYSIGLPAYNEAENLEILLPKIVNELDSLNTTYEILVVDANPSVDNTEEICKSLGIKYVKRENGNTYGDAFRSLLKHATGQWLITMDADGSHEPRFIKKMIAKVKDHAKSVPLIIASRYIDGGGTDNNNMLVLMSRLLNMIYGRLLNFKCFDISNSFRLYSLECLKNIKLTANHFDILEEVLFLYIKENPQVEIQEIPYHFKERMCGKSKRAFFTFLFFYLKTLMKLLYKKYFSR